MAWMEEKGPTQSSWSNVPQHGPPKQTVLLDSSMCRCGSALGNLLFVSPEHLLVSVGNHVACYAIRPPQKAKLLWKWTWSGQPITSMVSVSHNTVLLGSQHGHLTLLDWTQQQQAAFSVSPMPTIVRQWSTLTAFAHPKSVGAMGIVHLVPAALSGPILHVSWHTPGGWAVQARLPLSSTTTTTSSGTKHALRAREVEVLYATPKIVSYNDRGQVVANMTTTDWSLPASGSVTGTGSTQSLVWTKVPAVSQYLPPQDQRVLVGNGVATSSSVLQRFVRDEDNEDAPSLMLCHRSTGRVHSIPLVTNTKKKQPQPSWTVSALALHPSEEWLLVATTGGGATNPHSLRIYNSRNRI